MLDALAYTVATKPESPAFYFLGKSYNWAEMGDQINRFAAGLQSQGLKKGDKVGLFLPNSPTFLVAYYGVMKAGGTVVNYNPLYALRELVHQVEDSETDIMVTLDLKILYDKAYEVLQTSRLKRLIVGKFTEILPFPKNILFPVFKGKERAQIDNDPRILTLQDLMNNDGTVQPVSIDTAHDIAVLQYTGGTTGTPKGAMLTHRNIYANAFQAYSNFPKSDEHRRMLAVLPFFHVFAMTVTLNISVMGGMEILTLPRFDLNQSLDLIHKKKPHFMAGVPAIFNAINNHAAIQKFNLSSLLFCISGGAPLPVEVKRIFEEKTGCVVVEGYGLTEASPVCHVNPPLGKNIAGSIGLPLPQTIVEIINPDDKITPMPIGERGEVCISGPQVMRGYWNKQEASDDVLRRLPDGRIRLHTGDIGIMDDAGYTYIVDRIKDMIITNGYNVFPRNIEEAIYMHPDIEECIVAGLPDAQRGEIVKAWVKLKTGAKLDEKGLREFLQDKISKMEMPRSIEFRSAPLPKTMIGKLSRKDIVAQEKT
jgi:long-chain acyl-CoA synthetase